MAGTSEENKEESTAQPQPQNTGNTNHTGSTGKRRRKNKKGQNTIVNINLGGYGGSNQQSHLQQPSNSYGQHSSKQQHSHDQAHSQGSMGSHGHSHIQGSHDPYGHPSCHSRDEDDEYSHPKSHRKTLNPAKSAVVRGAYCFLLAGSIMIVLGAMYKSERLPVARKSQAIGTRMADAVLLGGFCSSKMGGCYTFEQLAQRQAKYPVIGALLAGLDRIWTLQVVVGSLALLTGLALILYASAIYPHCLNPIETYVVVSIGCGEHDDNKLSVWTPVRVGLAYTSAAGIFCSVSLNVIIASTAFYRYDFRDAIVAVRPFMGATALCLTFFGCFSIRPFKEGGFAHALNSDDFEYSD